MEGYLNILTESLEKKLQILQEIYSVSQKQNVILNEDRTEFEAYDQCVDLKDELLSKLAKLDEGFEVTYNHIKEGLVQNRSKYAGQISRLQELIGEITEKSMSIQALEDRNKQAMEGAFRKEKERLGLGRRSSKAAMDYYKNVNNSTVIPSHFLDKKK